MGSAFHQLQWKQLCKKKKKKNKKKKKKKRIVDFRRGNMAVSRFPVSAGGGGGKGGGAGNFIGGLLEEKGAVLTGTYILLRD